MSPSANAQDADVTMQVTGDLANADSDAAVTPGDELGMTHEYKAGAGTYERDDRIYASVLGYRRILPPSTSDDLPTVTVSAPNLKSSSIIPEVDSTVIGRVVRINPRQATLSILIVGGVPCSENFQGVIRVQDVRATEKDKVQIYKCYRPGDIVKAQVISLGDSRSYFLSTAKNELGVIFAESAAGHTMFPINWEEMMCPVTLTKEFRKCAKPSATPK